MSVTLLHLVLPWLQAFADAAVPSLFGVGLVWLRQHKVNTAVVEAVGRAAGEAYKQMVQAGGGATPATLNAAVAQGKDYLLASIPAALKTAGVTPEGAAQMVSGELGKLLAVDPSVSVGKAA